MERQLHTIWSEIINPELVLPEYPRPQLMRKGWINLNGLWDYAFLPPGKKPLDGCGAFLSQGKILVPFSPESELSGVRRQLQPDEILWYHRILILPEETGLLSKKKILLHFGAADQFAKIYVNGRKAGRHMGGYLPFTLDITSLVKAGENDLCVSIRDVSDTSYHSRGKQKLMRGGMYYTATSGLWQTVWIEIVPEDYISEILVETLPDAACETAGCGADIETRKGETSNNKDSDPSAQILITAGKTGLPVSLTVYKPAVYDQEEFSVEAQCGEDSAVLLKQTVLTGRRQTLHLPGKRFWSPKEPWLYYFTAEMGDDFVTGYFALRTIAVRPDEKGIARVYLNGRPYYQRGVLDQGYWPEGLYTPPRDEAFVFDIREMKKTGFNMVRKHAKIEADRWYYHCDRLGLLVWQDMVNGGAPYKDWFVTYLATLLRWGGVHISDRHRGILSRKNPYGRKEFEQEMEAAASALRVHPSIICWVLFNEGWGQFDTKRLTGRLRTLDPGRLIDSASGWFDQKCGDFISTHFYYFTYRVKPDRKRASVLSEVGGYALYLPEHSMYGKVYGYRQDETKENLVRRYQALIRWMDSLREKGLCGYVYTQWTDIEEEVNGIYTYDRKVRKIPEESKTAMI